MPAREDDYTPHALAAVAAEHGTRITASLIRASGGDFQMAEDAFQEGLLVALQRWPHDGIPDRPEAWVFTAARRKLIDWLRRDQTMARKREILQRLLEQEQAAMAGPQPGRDDEIWEDDRLRLIFTCCHPALAVEAQVALTLKVVAGLDTPEIASAFLVPFETMAKRLARAKAKIRDAGIPYQVPAAHQLPDRLASVLTVIYLVFNEGYLATRSEALIRGDLCDEAVRLGRLLMTLMPDEAEVLALLALMLFTDSRRSARTDGAGDLVTLEEQDRAQWDRGKIGEGSKLLEAGLRMRPRGPFLVQAAIAALHAEAERPQDTDWPQIALLYGQMLRLQPDSVVRLNYAAAVAMAFGPESGLRLMDSLEAEGALAEYHLLPAARADLLRRAGRLAEAAAAYEKAIGLCANAVERRYLERRLGEVSGQ